MRRAIDILEKIIKIYGTPIYVRHELVHNDYVVNQFLEKGVIFINAINEVPNGSVLIFSAHGVSNKIREQAKIRDLIVFDATCPLVSKVHLEVRRASRDNMEVILIGHSGHPEVEGTLGQYTNIKLNRRIYLVESEIDAWCVQVNCPDNLFFVTQTTLSIDDTSKIIAILHRRFPNIVGPRKNDICYATFNRQNALKKLVLVTDVILVIGSNTSSNSMRLIELAGHLKKCAYLINDADDIQKNWLYNVYNIGITAGASVPDILISKVIDKLHAFNIGLFTVTEMSEKKENIFFDVPKNLMKLEQ